MLKIFNYEKPGRGVREDEPQKKGIFLFFDILVHRMKYFILLNLLFILTSIPVVTIGPSFAAMTYVLKTYSAGEHSWGVSDYFEAFKRYFKKGFFMGIINILFAFGFVHNFLYFLVSDGLFSTYMAWLFGALIVLLIIVHSYVYTLLVSTEESVLELYTDAFILALAKLPVNLAAMVGYMLYPLLCAWLFVTGTMPIYISFSLASSIALFTVFSFTQFGAVFYTSSVIKRFNR